MKIICKPISMQGSDKWYSNSMYVSTDTAGILCFWPFLLPLLLNEVHQKLNLYWGNLPEWNVRSHFLRKLISNNNHRIAPLVLDGSSKYLWTCHTQSSCDKDNFRSPANQWVFVFTALINIPGTKIHRYKNHVTIIS